MIDLAVIYPLKRFFFAEKITTNRISFDFHHRISRLGGNLISEVRFTKTKKEKKSVDEKSIVLGR